MGLWIPVEVSFCVIVIRSYLPVERAASIISGVVGWPSSDSKRSAAMPLDVHILCHLLPKAPIENTAALVFVKLLTAPSIRPLPDDVDKTIVLLVIITFWSFSEIDC